MRMHRLFGDSRGFGLWLLPVFYLFLPWLLAACWPWFRVRLGEEIWIHRAGKEATHLSPCHLNQWTASFTHRIEHGEPNHEKSITEVLTDQRASCDQMAWILQRVAIKAGYTVWTVDVCPTIHQMVLLQNPSLGTWLLDPYEVVKWGEHPWTCMPLRTIKEIPPLPKTFPFTERPFCYTLYRVPTTWKMKAWHVFVGAYAWWFPLEMDVWFLRWFTDLPIPQV